MSIQLTDGEMKIIHSYVTVMTGLNSGNLFKDSFKSTLYSVQRLIIRYGDDGYGDKPPEMDRITYWLSHLN